MAGRRYRVHHVGTAGDARVKLVLFDIDGTLLLTDGAGRRAIQRALTDATARGVASGHRFDGKTDPQIVRELMRAAGHADDRIDAELPGVLERYLSCLQEELLPPNGARPYPGVMPLLTQLETRRDALVGLLTGNIAAGARAKLTAAGFDMRTFRVGAYGSDHEDRSALPEIARARAHAIIAGELDGTDVVIIGDTPSDVRCGQRIGARAIGVATGHYSSAELMDCGAAAVFETLEDTSAVLDAIFATNGNGAR
jgi:phosphoglycolate phosphatase-like HAD superfamily hydrolase